MEKENKLPLKATVGGDNFNYFALFCQLYIIIIQIGKIILYPSYNLYHVWYKVLSLCKFLHLISNIFISTDHEEQNKAENATFKAA